MTRRNLMKTVLASALIGASAPRQLLAQSASKLPPEPASDRAYMSGLLYQIAQPVLSSMAEGKLQKNFQLEVSPTWDGRDKKLAYMEAFSRLICGVAPWVTLPEDSSVEGKQRKQIHQWALQSFTNAVDPSSPDYLLWRKEYQPLVDSAFFTTALLRAPKQLWEPLSSKTKARIVEELKLLRRVNPPYTNWLLFTAINEAFLLSIGEQYDPVRINLAIRKMNEWYVGDGWFGNGDRFHMDFYNSYVMHPIMLEIMDILVKTGEVFGANENQILFDQELKRCQRYTEFVERIISPEATFPMLGRSMTYRTAAFQPLALLAWRKQLPANLPEGQVRAALTAVHRRLFASAGNFDANGYLTIGFAGHQPSLGDFYTNNGSMYITSQSFLALGLPATDSYWTAPATSWTTKKAFANEPFNKDYAVAY